MPGAPGIRSAVAPGIRECGNETLIGTYEYRHNFIRAFNMYSKDKTGGLGDDGQAWALETVQQLVVDLGNNPKIAKLIAEYQLYFPDASLKKPAQE